MNKDLLRASAAELIGTFVLIFVGAASVVIAPRFGLVVPALGHNLILIGGKQDPIRSAVFIAVQFLAGILAAFLLSTAIPHSNTAFMAAFIGSTRFNFGVTTGVLTADHIWSAAILEAILTFFLVSTVYQAAVFGSAGDLAGVAIGCTLAGCILAGGVLTGASLNPARTLGPALAAGDLSYVLAYFVGIFGGGIVGGLLHSSVLNPH